MHTSLDDIPRLRRLVDEVCELIESPSLLAGSTVNERTLRFGDSSSYCWKRVLHIEYSRAINIRNDDSSYLELNSRMAPNSEAYIYYGAYAPMKEVDGLLSKLEFIYSALHSRPAVVRLAEQCHTTRVRECTASDYLEHIVNTISNHLHSIAYSRIVTLGRRFALAESLFDVYCSGLMPFGFDRDSEEILCVGIE